MKDISPEDLELALQMIAIMKNRSLVRKCYMEMGDLNENSPREMLNAGEFSSA